MTSPLPRSIAFRVPLSETVPEPYGFQPGRGGRTAMVEGTESIRQAILLLLLTRPGERVMRPTYGCDLHRLLFSPNDDTTAGLAIHYVRRAIERFEPRVEIVELDATRHAERPGQLELMLEYRIRDRNVLDSMRLAVDLMGGG